MYKTWSKRATLIQAMKWYNVHDLVRAVHTLSDQLLGPGGQVVAAHVPRMATACPASPHNRFPATALYVCEGVGVWHQTINRFLLTAAVLADSSRLERKYPGVRTLGEAEVTLLDCFDEILTHAENLIDVFDQSMFESRYKLEWCAK
ncbi:hypothetical protein BJV82DRAFT_521176 [Fennellomyces sp. T-0311]|nr:hypothetical protein BJV82DRAFT_521176 [Fennellomyces sp. T-0311]